MLQACIRLTTQSLPAKLASLSTEVLVFDHRPMDVFSQIISDGHCRTFKVDVADNNDWTMNLFCIQVWPGCLNDVSQAKNRSGRSRPGGLAVDIRLSWVLPTICTPLTCLAPTAIFERTRAKRTQTAQLKSIGINLRRVRRMCEIRLLLLNLARITCVQVGARRLLVRRNILRFREGCEWTLG
jgi:hypothetical protein